MHAERDVLITVVFPELRERLDRLGLDFFDVDLRWGVPQTGVDGERANSWAYCKQWIKRVEPFFVCMLGQRYGWVPPADDIRDPEDRAEYEGLSITEMEIRHAVLSGRHRRRSYFYLRATEVPRNDTPVDIYESFVEIAEAPRLTALKRAISETSGRPVRDYPCRWNGSGFSDLDEFGDWVLEDLWSGVLRDERYVSKAVWRTVLGHDPETDPIYTDDSRSIPRETWEPIVEAAKPAPADPLDAEAAEMAAFATSRLRWFQGRAHELQQLRAFVDGSRSENESRLCVVRAVAGAGKTALMAKLAEQMAATPHLVITHFVGVTERSANVRSLLERLVNELDRHGVPHPAETDAKQDLESLRARLASRIDSYASDRRIVLLLDGINQLTDGHDLSWLPHRLGDDVRVIVSSIDDPDAVADSPQTRVMAALQRRQPTPEWTPVGALEASDVLEIVDAFLLEYCKELDSKDKNSITDMDQAKNPLYLLVMLHELRTLGGHDMHLRVHDIIKRLPERCPNSIQLFDWVLERLQEAFGEEPVRRWCVYLSLGRVGMSGRELRDLLTSSLGAGGAKAALRIERSIRRYLLRRGRQWDFFHGQMREAVARRYGALDHRARHVEVARYFETRWRERDTHAISELPHHEVQGELWDDLERSLCDLEFVEAKCSAGMTDELVSDYRVALSALPEGQEERQQQRMLDTRVSVYAQEIVEYARRWSDARDRYEGDAERNPLPGPQDLEVPIPPSSIRPWTKEEIQARAELVQNAPTRFDRIRAFGSYVSAERHHLSRFADFPGFCCQQAHNSALSGPVVAAAQVLLAEREENENPLLLRAPAQRTGWNPHPAWYRTFVGCNTISKVALGFEGRIALTAGGGLQMWDLATGSCRTLVGSRDGLDEETFDALAISADGRRAVSGDRSGTVRVWDLESGECIRTLKGHADRVSAVDITPDGRRVVSGSGGQDRTLRVWDVASGRCERTLEGDPNFHFAHISADGLYAAFNLRGQFGLSNLETGKRSEPPIGFFGALSAVLSVDRRRAVTGNVDGTLRVWSLETGRCVGTLTGHSASVKSVAITADCERAVSGGFDGTYRSWDLGSGQCQAVFGGNQVQVGSSDIAITPDGRRAITCQGDNTFRVWELQTAAATTIVEEHRVSPGNVAVTPSGERAVSLSDQGTLRVWDLASGGILRTLGTPSRNTVSSGLAITPDGRRVVCLKHPMFEDRVESSPLFSTSLMQAWEIDTGLEEWSVKSVGKGALAVTADGRRAVSGGYNGSIVIWDVETGLFDSFKGLATDVSGVAIAPEGRRAVCATQDGGLSMWDVETGVMLGDVKRSHRPVPYGRHVINFTPDGRYAMSFGSNGPYTVWNLLTGTAVVPEATLDGHYALSPFQREALSLLRGRGNRQDVNNDRAVEAFLRHPLAASTPDGERLISMSMFDDTVRFSDVNRGTLLALYACDTHPTTVRLRQGAIVVGTYLGLSILIPSQQLFARRASVTAAVLWRFGEGGKPGHWDDCFTVVCYWCGHRFPVESPDGCPEAVNVDCPNGNCRKPLSLNPFVCDARDSFPL